MLKPGKILSYFILPTFFYAIHVFLDLVFDIYTKYPWFASIMHFSGGIILTFTFFPLLNYLHKENYLKLDNLSKFIFVISLVISFAVFWEFYEFAVDSLFNLKWQPSLADTIEDLALGMLGGMITSLVFLRKK